MFDSLYEHLNVNNLSNPNQSSFCPGDSTINQLLSIVHTIFTAFDCNHSLDVRSVFLIYLKHLTECGMMVLSISCSVVVFAIIYLKSLEASLQTESNIRF